MKSEWMVFYNCVAGYEFYEVGRILDDSKPWHSGNIEFNRKEIFLEKKKAEKFAQKLNKAEVKNETSIV